MRMPNSRQISEEQQDIFEEAPIDGVILVSGPPGTGKTVIAFLRAQTIAKRKQDVVVLMYNRVLRRYTENVASEIEGSVESRTMHSWFPEWWRKHRIPQDATSSARTLILEDDKAYLNCPFKDRLVIKENGGQWDSNKWNPFDDRRQNGMWYVPLSSYQADPKAYGTWTGTSFEPVEIKKWQYDWLALRDQYLDLDEDQGIDWGHLIIDEAQDFEPGMYSFLRMAGMQLENGGITILADENQRLEESRHSSLQDIRTALKIKPDREFRLTKNFRNTRQIAEVARCFYVGLETGIPELPDKKGSRPVLLNSANTGQQIDYIGNYLQFRGALEVGVIVDSNSDRSYFFEKLSESLPNYTVQTYTRDDPWGSDTLTFDKQGVVTVLHRKSCKGLEFDTVFVPQLQNVAVEDADITAFKMNMYVICSRARTELVFLSNGGSSSNPEFFRHFPDQESGLIEYRVQK